MYLEMIRLFEAMPYAFGRRLNPKLILSAFFYSFLPDAKTYNFAASLKESTIWSIQVKARRTLAAENEFIQKQPVNFLTQS